MTVPELFYLKVILTYKITDFYGITPVIEENGGSKNI